MPILHHDYRKNASDILFIMIHGGGYTHHTWLPLIDAMEDTGLEAQYLLCDLRGHGESLDCTDYSLEALANDIKDTVDEVVELPKFVILVGHSLGASIAIHLSFHLMIPRVIGIVDIDVVEGTALEALQFMKNIVQQRPEQFSTIDQAIQWAVRSNHMTPANAKNSIPHQLIKNGNNYMWRTNLLATQEFWEDWFIDLSEKFLKCKCGKLLVLASTNRLDTALTIAQMQGKYQVEILPYGHALHEESPGDVARILLQFYKRQLPIKLPPKFK
eukprot:NODE_465_length_7087_cov_1.060962.p4 type:complete len:272 gc:universal NODE_465_length_7087_cov_1.060962:102-917(+)